MKDLGLASEIAGLENATTFTWSGGTYTGAISGRTNSKQLDAGGYALTEDQQLVCSTVQFTARPAAEQTVVIAGETLRIESVVTSPCDSFLVIQLKTDGKGA